MSRATHGRTHAFLRRNQDAWREAIYRCQDTSQCVKARKRVLVPIRLIYASQAAFDFAPEQLVDLLTTSRANNSRDGLSGMLLYSSQSFLQLLEGEQTTLDAAFKRISSDTRHGHVRVLMRELVSAPMFPDWNMGFEHLDEDELAENILGYTPATDYPLVNPDLVVHAGVAQTLFKLYSGNRVR